jgi:hypothetical protein
MLDPHSPPLPGRSRLRTNRRLRSVAALVVTALAAPIAFVAAAIPTALPAAAAPRTLVVSGDDGARNTVGPGAWTFFGSGNDYAELKTLITDPANFGGPSAVVKDTTFTISPTPITTVTSAALAGIDVFVSSAVAPGYSAPELQALRDFVDGGGVVIASTNSQFINSAAAAFGGAFVDDPPGRFEPFTGDHECADYPGASCATGTEVVDASYSAPQAAQITAPTSPLADGPFGTVTSFRNWHTVAKLINLPAEAQTVATLSLTCTPDLSNPQAGGQACGSTAAQIQQGPTAGAGDDCDYDTGSATLPDCPQEPYNNNFGANAPVLATIPFGTPAWGAGAVVMTSDLDTFANHDEYMTSLLPGNRTLALNTFAWIANTLNPPVSTTPPVDGFTATAPVRILDTRNNIGLSGAFTAAQSRSLSIAGANGVPANASAVALNVTATNATANAFLTVYPSGVANPGTSSVNFEAGKDVANMVIVTLGTGGAASFYNDAGTTDVIADIVGYFTPNAGDKITSTVPERIVDTRSGKGAPIGPIEPGGSRTVNVRSLAATVPDGATAVALNVTATEGSLGGFLTVYPSDVAKPGTSNVNFRANTNVPNLVMTKLSASGDITIYNDNGTTNVVVDVFAYFGATGGLLKPVTPARLLDTRGSATVDGQFATGVAVAPGGVVDLTVLGRGPVPATGVSTVVLNVTATQPTLGGFISTWPDAKPTELTSNLNFLGGQTVPNLVVAQVGPGGVVHVYNDTGSTHILADVVAWFS